MQIHWTPNASVSALHIAECSVLFPEHFTDPQWLSAFQPDAMSIHRWAVGLGLPSVSIFWSTLISNASQIESNYELVSATLRKVAGMVDSSSISMLVGKVTEIEATFKELNPKFDDQIRFRMRPLQDAWLGFGNGLLAHVRRMTEKELLTDSARVIPVSPVLNGYGVAHWQSNIARIEAVLTNPMPELPEVVRLVWLLSQLNLELPRFSETLGSVRLGQLAPLAVLPAALAAAQVLELSRCSDEMAALAIEHWQIPVPAGASIADTVVPLLMSWWETYLQTRPPFEVAMQALSKMLGL